MQTSQGRRITALLSSVHKGDADLKDYVYAWNISFPIDRWWREKHKIPFGSDPHRESSFESMIIEYHEDVIYNNLNKVETYKPGSGDIFKAKIKEERSIREEEEYDDIFDNIKI